VPAHVGCFQSRVIGVGPQVGYIFPIGDKMQNLWLTFNLSPAAATPPTPSRPMFTK